MLFNYQRELNWNEPFQVVLGAYIGLPPKTILWGANSTNLKNLYQFSAPSEKCCISFCAENHLNLIDLRYAIHIYRDILELQIPDIIEPHSIEYICKVCMVMKELSKYDDNYTIDGIIINAINGNHIVLFDVSVIHKCDVKEPVKLREGIEYAYQHDRTPLHITDCVRNYRRLYTICDQTWEASSLWGDFKLSPHVSPILPECSIEECSTIIDLNEVKWQSDIKLRILGQRHVNLHLHDQDKICTDNKARMPDYMSIQWNYSFIPVYGSFIELPKNMVLWRGYDTQYPALANRPVYFGDQKIAQSYAETSPTHTLGTFATTKPLKLLDIRFLKVLLTDLFENYNGDIVMKTSLAFGLCSLYHQLRLMKTVYKDSIQTGRDVGYNAMENTYKVSSKEQSGFRVAETSNDGWVMSVLGEIFDGIADGFISPKLPSPYQVHTNGILHPELIVFNPVKSGIIQLTSVPPTTPITISQLIHQQYPPPVTLSAYGMETIYAARYGGSVSYTPAIETFNDLLNQGDKYTIKQYREAVKVGKQFRKRVTFFM